MHAKWTIVNPTPQRSGLVALCLLFSPWLLLGCGSDQPALVDGGDEPDVEAGADASSTQPVDCSERSNVLRGGGKSAGQCAVDCRFELELSNVIVLDTQSCVGYSATLNVYDNDGAAAKRTISADLTRSAWLKSQQIGEELASQALDESYGCPDCDDGGASSVLTAGGASEVRSHKYESGKAPAVLKDADAFVQGLIAQMLVCKGESLEDCDEL